MDKPNHIFIPERIPDFSPPLPAMRAPAGKVIVAIPFPPDSSRGILLPETVKGRLRPDCGIVVSVGAGTPLDINHGDIVLVRPYDGMWIEDSDISEHYQIRIYGQERNDDGDFVNVAVNESIVLK